MRILLVEDDVEARTILAKLFKAAGHSSRFASNVHVAIGMLADFEPFDAIVSDYDLGRVTTGCDLYHFLGAGQYKDRFVMFTATDKSELSFSRTPPPIIEKPNFDALLAAVEGLS